MAADHQPHRVERSGTADVEDVPLGAAETDIGHHFGHLDLADQRAVRVVAVDPVPRAGPDAPVGIEAEAIEQPGRARCEFAATAQRAVGTDIVDLDVLGMRRAMEIMLTGGEMLGPEAAQIGWANRSFPAVALDDEVLDVASQIAAVATDLAQINKRMVHRQAEIMGVRAAIRAGSEFQALAGHQASVEVFKQDPLSVMKRHNAADAERREAREKRRSQQ